MTRIGGIDFCEMLELAKQVDANEWIAVIELAMVIAQRARDDGRASESVLHTLKDLMDDVQQRLPRK